MERAMHRKDRQLSEQEAWDILQKGNTGVLSVVGDEGWPYAVPMNYIVWNRCIYLHCAKHGYKLDAIRRDGRVCFTVVTGAQLVPEKISTAYESVIVLGTAAVVEDGSDEWQGALEHLIDDLGDVPAETRDRYIRALGPRTAMLRVTPGQITAKANRRIATVSQRLGD